VATHRLDASPQTIHWGYFDAQLPPLLTVDSGDTVTISTVSGGPEAMPKAPFVIPQALSDIHAAHKPKLPGHICTGPVAVRGAKAGQVLEVRIKSVELHYDWGFTYSAPLKGALPDDFDEIHFMTIPLDRERMTGRLPWGLELPLKPFFGVMAVAPPASRGRSAPCRRAATAAISTTRSLWRERYSTCRSMWTAPCSRSATGTGFRATERSA
jgi:acetamidase/formamidase